MLGEGAHRFTASGRNTKLIHWISDERRSFGADRFSCMCM